VLGQADGQSHPEQAQFKTPDCRPKDKQQFQGMKKYIKKPEFAPDAPVVYFAYI
jgi:hypothetical protein